MWSCLLDVVAQLLTINEVEGRIRQRSSTTRIHFLLESGGKAIDVSLDDEI